jgi:hypothetical protein
MTHSPVAAVEEVAVEEDSTVAGTTGAVPYTLDVAAAARWQLEVSTEGRLTEAVPTEGRLTEAASTVEDTALRQ